MTARFTLAAALVALLLSACASRGPVVAPSLEAGADRVVELSDTPFFPQTENYCGPAALATVLSQAGVRVNPAALGERVYLPAKRGSLQVEMVAAARSYGRMPYEIDDDLSALLAELQAGRPVLIFQNLGIELIPVWHYAVVVGYDAIDDVLILRSGEERRRLMPAAELMETWERAGRWGLVVLEPGALPARPSMNRYLEAAAAMESVSRAEVSLQWFQAAAERWPDSAIARFALGNALYAADRLTAAAEAYRRAVNLDPGLAAARNNLAHVLMEQGCLERALTEIRAARETGAGGNPGLARMLSRTHEEIRAALDRAGEPPSASCGI